MLVFELKIYFVLLRAKFFMGEISKKIRNKKTDFTTTNKR